MSDVFPLDRISEDVEPLFYATDQWEQEIRNGRVKAFISFMENSEYQRIYHHVQEEDWWRRHMDNFTRCLHDSKTMNFFQPNEMQWDKVLRKLERSPQRPLKNTDNRMGFRLDNMFLVKHGFTFGQWIVENETAHVFQTSHVPLLCYELPESSCNSASKPNLYRRSFPVHDQYLYQRYVLRPHKTYFVPERTRYLVLAVQKTLFSVDVVKKVPSGALSFKTHAALKQSVYDVPTPMHRVEMVTPEERKRKQKWGNFKIPKRHAERSPRPAAERSPRPAAAAQVERPAAERSPRPAAVARVERPAAERSPRPAAERSPRPTAAEQSPRPTAAERSPRPVERPNSKRPAERSPRPNPKRPAVERPIPIRPAASQAFDDVPTFDEAPVAVFMDEAPTFDQSALTFSDEIPAFDQSAPVLAFSDKVLTVSDESAFVAPATTSYDSMMAELENFVQTQVLDAATIRYLDLPPLLNPVVLPSPVNVVNVAPPTTSSFGPPQEEPLDLSTAVLSMTIL